jgi:uncharacterized cupin superfamily protein
MRRLNISDPEFTYDPEDPEGYRAGMCRLGPDLGSERTGTTLYHLPPGELLCPYHYEYGEEEWLLVLDGRPILRHPEGEDALEPWDVVCFPSGPEGAHAVRNATEEPVRVLMASTVTHPCATVYPDSGKIGIWTGNDADPPRLFAIDAAVDYWDGEL